MSSKIGFLFPGQGALDFNLLGELENEQEFSYRYSLIRDVLDSSFVKDLDLKKPNILETNEVSSLLTILASSIFLDLYTKDKPDYFAGYSVGQWTALYAAGSVNFETLVHIIKIRADIMNKYIQKKPSSMIAVIGLSEGVVKSIVENLKTKNHMVEISNYNCLGQYSISISNESLEPVLRVFESYSPKKLVVLPVSGGWHSSFLNSADTEFFNFLEQLKLNSPKIPVIDNVTGEFLPDTIPELKTQLARHLNSPVLWEKGIRTLINAGCSKFIEIGYGNTLTKFGYFIDRSLEHVSFSL